MTGDLDPRPRRGYVAREVEHDQDPADDADAFVVIADDGELVFWVGPEIEDVVYGVEARALFAGMVEDSRRRHPSNVDTAADEGRALRDVLDHRNYDDEEPPQTDREWRRRRGRLGRFQE